MQSTIVLRPLIDSEYALSTRTEILEKLQRADELKLIMNEANVNSQIDALEVKQAAEEFNKLTNDIISLRRSLYIYGYKDDTTTLVNSYILRMPDEPLTDNMLQILAINSRSEFIKFNPNNQYYYSVNENDITQKKLLTEHVIELFERGFGEITKFIVLLIHDKSFHIYKIFTGRGKVLSIKECNDSINDKFITQTANVLI